MNDYYGVCEWLRNSGFVIMAHNCPLQLPLSGNIEEGNFRMYLSDTSLLFASMDDEAQMMIRKNNDFSIYNGAIYESIIAAELKKQGYELCFYRSSDSTIELDFLVRFENEIVPIEVKAKNGNRNP